MNRIALHAQHRFRTQRRGAHDLRLQRKPVAVSARHVNDRADSLLTRERDRGQRGHPRLAGVVVGQPDHVDCVGQDRDAITDARSVRPGRQRDLGRRHCR
jgi:hypothetical protein